jgi:hypothetical protein
MSDAEAPTKTVGAKMVLYDDGTVAVSVFFVEPGVYPDRFLTYEIAADREAAQAVVEADAAAQGVEIGDIRYEDRRKNIAKRHPAPGKAN